MKISNKNRIDLAYKGRHIFLLLILLVLFLGVLLKLIDLTVFNRNFLVKQGEQRIVRKMPIYAHRGMILDLHGVPLSISTAKFSIWSNPSKVKLTKQQIYALAKLLKLNPAVIKHKFDFNNLKFIYLKRHVDKDTYLRLKQLNIPGIAAKHEFYRNYPLGKVAAQIIGFTNVEDEGQEGLELALDYWLKGESGYKLVETDLYGNIVNERKIIKPAKQGKNVQVTIDNRLQYIAYKHLNNTLLKSGAKWGSVVIMEPKTGRVLSIVNLPSFNPNKVKSRLPGSVRNRAVSDMYEPGSTLKPLLALALLQKGYTSLSKVNVGSGNFKVQGHMIHDEVKNLGNINLAYALKKSSNVGMAKFALQLPVEHIINTYRSLGLGKVSGSGLPGEVAGRLQSYVRPLGFDHAAMGYGYGLAVTNLQLAHAYSVIANHGVDMGVHLIKQDIPKPKILFKPQYADRVLQMLHGVTAKDGSGRRARVKGVEVAGKTGTALIAGPNGYQAGHVNVSFVGIAPLKNPKLVVAIVLGAPKRGWRFGGITAAPIFSKIVADSLVLLEK